MDSKTKICDEYCKYPYEWDEDKEGCSLDESDVCKNCPLNTELVERSLVQWITDRDPTLEEREAVEATGFIICLSGTLDNVTYDHAIDMQDNWYEDGRWYLHGVHPNKTIGLQGDEHEVFKVHGWMLPPAWRG